MTSNKRGATPNHTIMAALMVTLMVATCFCVFAPSAEESDGAIMQAPSYTVRFIAPDADGTKSAEYSVNEGTTYELPVTTFTREGWYLKYWEGSDGKQYDPGQTSDPVTGDMTYTAVWEQFSTGHGDVYKGVYTQEIGSPETQYNLESIAGGYGRISKGDTFADWLDPVGTNTFPTTYEGTPNRAGVYIVAFDQSIVHISPTYYWFQILVPSTFDTSYTVNFDFGEGATVSDNVDTSVARPIGMNVSLPDSSSATMEGATLTGWTLSITGNPATFAAGGMYTVGSTTMTGDSVTLEAEWTFGTYILLVNPMNAPGVWAKGGNYGDYIQLEQKHANQVHIDGYTWNGYIDEASPDIVIPFNAYYQLRGDIDIVGYWVPTGSSTYTVTFNMNGGSHLENDLSPVDVESGTKVFLPEYGPVRDNYTFLGWSTDPNATRPMSDSTITVTSDVTLYAVWRENTNPVTSIHVSGNNLIQVGQTTTLTAYAEPSTADNRTVYFDVIDSTDNPVVSVVDENPTGDGGTLTLQGLRAGTVTVRAYAADGSNTFAEYSVTVQGESQVNYQVLIYDANGGSGGPGTIRINTGSATSYDFQISSSEPIRSGFIFKGWADSADADTAVYGLDSGLQTHITVQGEKRIYAVWEPSTKTITITYHANGVLWPGLNSEEKSESFDIESDSIELRLGTGPTRIGYEFKGWSTEQDTQADAEGLIMPGAKVTVTEDITYYAIWLQTTRTFTLNFNANGGTGGPSSLSESVPSMSYTFDIPADVPTYEGKVFLGWSTDRNGDPVYSYDGLNRIQLRASSNTSSVTEELFAIWGNMTNDYVVHLDPNGGEGDLPDVVYNGTASETTHDMEIPFDEEHTPTREDHVFVGWALSESARSPSVTAEWNTVPMTNKDLEITLYAFWQAVESEEFVYLTYNANGGENAPGAERKELVDNVAEFIISSDTPTREGYDFKGWSLDPEAETASIAPGDPYPINENTTLYAVWASNTVDITLRFNYNGATGGPGPIVKSAVNGSASFDIPEETPSRSGYTFLGWSPSEGSSTASIFPGDTGIILTGDTTIFAVWMSNGELTEFVLNFDLRGGTGDFDPLTYTGYETQYDFDIPRFAPTSEDGSMFMGWSVDPEAEQGDYGVGGKFTVYAEDSEQTLYAIWGDAPDSYLITFYGYQDWSPKPQVVQSGAHITEPEVPEREGYTFLGWFLEGSDEPFDFENTVMDDSTTADGGLYLTAKWERVLAPDDPNGSGGDEPDHDPVTPNDDEDDGTVYLIAGSVAIVIGAIVALVSLKTNYYVIIPGIILIVVGAVIIVLFGGII